MHVITKILSILVAAEFLYIFYLLVKSSEKTSKVFGVSTEELKNKTVSTLFKNQGVYNALIAVLIFVAVLGFGSKTAVICLMCYIVAVALYGSITSNPKILPMQGGLAILTLLSCLL